MSGYLEYVVYHQCMTNASGQFYHGYGEETKNLQDIPLNEWKDFQATRFDHVIARRLVDKEREDFHDVQLIHIMLREEETKDIVEFLKSVEPAPFFRDGDCNKWKSINVHNVYIDGHVPHGQFTGQEQINYMLERFKMAYEFDYEGEARFHVDFPDAVNKIEVEKRQQVFEDALSRFMYLETLYTFLIRGMKVEVLKLGKLFIETHNIHGKPIIPSFFDE